MLAGAAQRGGWATGTGSIDEIREQAAELGWTEVATRRGDPPVSQLRPASRSGARPNSLSARYGLGAQPLHTDGAHLEQPPKFVVLLAEQPTLTPTLLYRLAHRPSGNPIPWDALRCGMFLVHNWRDSFFAPVHGSVTRYDPGCMSPCDQRAYLAVRHFEAALADAVMHEWLNPGQLLMIHNWSALHARAAVADGDDDRQLTRVAFAAVPK